MKMHNHKAWQVSMRNLVMVKFWIFIELTSNTLQKRWSDHTVWPIQHLAEKMFWPYSVTHPTPCRKDGLTIQCDSSNTLQKRWSDHTVWPIQHLAEKMVWPYSVTHPTPSRKDGLTIQWHKLRSHATGLCNSWRDGCMENDRVIGRTSFGWRTPANPLV